MNIVDIILDKRYGRALTNEQIKFFVKGVTDKSIPDYQISALLMAIVLNGMGEREMTTLTMEMAASGEQNDLSFVGDVTVDKHSTGGVGDKVTPIVMPLCHSFGVKIVKLTGRGLGFTGGTVDKFSSIEGFNIDIPKADFPRLVEETGMVLSGQTPDLAPADKSLYALRDVTGTVSSIPLIASSIMSKKLAGGADAIVLDVTTGTGAFMKTFEEARQIADAMIRIGERAGKKVIAVITDMDQPLGRYCGNVLEMKEVYDTLNGRGAEDVVEVSATIAAKMIKLAGKAGGLNDEELLKECKARLNDGRALAEYIKLIKSQGGHVNEDGPVYTAEPVCVYEVKAEESGFVFSMKTNELGHCSVALGAGRVTKDDVIDLGAGIRFMKKRGDPVRYGDVLCRLYVGKDSPLINDEDTLASIADRVSRAYEINSSRPLGIRPVVDVLGDKE